MTEDNDGTASASLRSGGRYGIEFEINVGMVVLFIFIGIVLFSGSLFVYYRMRIAHDPTRWLWIKGVCARLGNCCLRVWAPRALKNDDDDDETVVEVLETVGEAAPLMAGGGGGGGGGGAVGAASATAGSNASKKGGGTKVVRKKRKKKSEQKSFSRTVKTTAMRESTKAAGHRRALSHGGTGGDVQSSTFMAPKHVDTMDTVAVLSR
jgi:hypothetical protein